MKSDVDRLCKKKKTQRSARKKIKKKDFKILFII